MFISSGYKIGLFRENTGLLYLQVQGSFEEMKGSFVEIFASKPKAQLKAHYF